MSTSSTTSSETTSRSSIPLSLSGRSQLRFYTDDVAEEDLVEKTVPELDAEQPRIMRRHPGAYLPVYATMNRPDGAVTYVMPRAWAPDISRDGDAALVQGYLRLRDAAWDDEPPTRADRGWRDRLRDHLVTVALRVNVDPSLAVALAERADGTGDGAYSIHGDASLANLVYLPDAGWRWIDPMHRDYVPGLREVDVGKMLLSAHGVERVLLGIDPAPTPNRRLVNELLTLAQRDQIDVADCRVWMKIHALRILPYLPSDALRETFKVLLT